MITRDKKYYEIKFRKAEKAAKNQINNAGYELKAGLITISEFYKIVHKIDIKHNALYFKILDNLLKIRNKGVLNNEKSL